MNIYSDITGELLHIIIEPSDVEDRKDVIPRGHFLQLATMRLPKGKTFKPHRHIEKHRCGEVIAQESWVVIRGEVKAILYDIDNTVLREVILRAGDASVTLKGGHNYEIMDDATIVYEFKTGPYLGQEKDKVFI